MSKVPLEITKEVFEILKNDFPGLSMELNESPKYTDVELIVAVQDGLDFEVSLNLQNTDELHFNVDELAESYLAAVRGFLSGEYRIEVYSRKGNSYKSLLQSPVAGMWKTEYTHTSVHWPCFKPQIQYV